MKTIEHYTKIGCMDIFMHVFPIICPYILLLWEGRKQKLHLPAMIEPVYSDCHQAWYTQ